MKEQVLISTSKDYPVLFKRLTDAGLTPVVKPAPAQDFEAFVNAVCGYAYVIANGPWNKEALTRASSRLKLLVKFGVGVDNIDVKAAGELGIAVANAPGSNSEAVAEQAVALMLALARGVAVRDGAVRSGRWDSSMNDTLVGKTVGLMGFGNIARAVAKMLSGFPVRLIAYDILMDGESAKKLGVEPVGLTELCAGSDVLSLHIPANDQTRHIINAEFLNRLKNSAYIINTSRGSIVDETALVNALKNGRLRGAGLDTFETEPLPAGHPLLSLPNVVLSPHSASNTAQAFERIMECCVENVIAFSKGEYRNVINKDVIKK